MKSINSAVKVTADSAGNVVVPSKNNPEYGHIRVEQTRIIIDEKGFARRKPLSALIAGLVEDLQFFHWEEGDEVPGKIIYKEQLEPFNPKNPEIDYKIAGKTGVVCCIEGQPIYRKNFYVTDPNAQDVHIHDEFGNILHHDNGDDIRAAYAQQAEETIDTSIDLNDM